ncbi:MAG: NAD(+) diphosphatase [Pegethrix bostrychoides GSE-TBD4-15B]|jgi:NAD+ diphosphatase|uniref:NAD-capped RNA hydrolase NudC n=1 Tax=Pegethrix bostrychoides GSE-TBD4-15B TaxID=2839662 RepID=A0A951PBW5_9CYAN|nr:NAD(+) diphosphatase [Pegethrix bostrychoides GSE-TBD4-15B]
MGRSFKPSAIASPTTQPAWWFACSAGRLLVDAAIQPPVLPDLSELGLTPVRSQPLGMLDEAPCYSAELPPDTEAPANMQWVKLRELYGRMADDLFAIAGRAMQIVEWDRTHQYCGCCATPTAHAPTERAKRCPNCGLVSYPRLSPAVIMLIAREDEILLARAPRFPAGMYSILAGFVEPGESLEETVVREVREEVGVEIDQIRYFGSQPWPYPNSLMIGFTARYAGGEIVVDQQEIVEARWFHKRDLPPIPPPLSIARKIIDWFVAQS